MGLAIPKALADTNQIAAHAAWFKRMESACAQQRAEVKKARLEAVLACAAYGANSGNGMLKPEAGGAQVARDRGIILDHNPNTLSGLISGEDGKRWPFRAAEWVAGQADPSRGLWVDFVPEAETGYAWFVYSLGTFRAKHLELESPR